MKRWKKVFSMVLAGVLMLGTGCAQEIPEQKVVTRYFQSYDYHFFRDFIYPIYEQDSKGFYEVFSKDGEDMTAEFIADTQAFYEKNQILTIYEYRRDYVDLIRKTVHQDLGSGYTRVDIEVNLSQVVDTTELLEGQDSVEILFNLGTGFLLNQEDGTITKADSVYHHWTTNNLFDRYTWDIVDTGRNIRTYDEGREMAYSCWYDLYAELANPPEGEEVESIELGHFGKELTFTAADLEKLVKRSEGVS